MSNEHDLATGPKPDLPPEPKQVTTHFLERFIASHFIEVEQQLDGVQYREEEEDTDEEVDTGDSDVATFGTIAETSFDREWSSTLPLISQLPRRVNPPLRFYVDDEYTVHRLDLRNDAISNLGLLICCAIARHLREKNVQLAEPGNWRKIPAIGTDGKLFALMTSEIFAKAANVESEAKILRNMWKHLGAQAKYFAIIFTSGDVVTPQALIEGAQKNLESPPTRAGALREAVRRQRLMYEMGEVVSDIWKDLDWVKFEKAQRRAQSED